MEPTQDKAVFPVFQITRALLIEMGFPEETVETLSDEEMQRIASSVSQGMRSVFKIGVAFATQSVIRGACLFVAVWQRCFDEELIRRTA